MQYQYPRWCTVPEVLRIDRLWAMESICTQNAQRQKNVDSMIADRRRRPRVGLHYVVRLTRPDQWTSVKTETANLSSSGFYCTSDEPFSPGEQLNCEVVIPSKDIGYDSTDLVLHRRVKVVRVEIKGLEPGFGVACEFDDRIPLT